MLEFLHPHIETHITDNSQYSVGYPTVSGSTILFQPFISDKGEDNVLKKYTSLKELLEEVGTPNFKNHGQALYNAAEWLRVGGVLYGMRVMPENATFSNLVLNVMTSEIKEEDDGEKKKLMIKTAITNLGNVRDAHNLEVFINDLPKTTTESVVIEDSEDPVEVVWNNHYLACFLVRGRGTYGNNYSVNIKLNNYSKNLYDYRCYDINILENNSVIEGPYTVSFHPYATNIAGNPLSVQEVIETYSKDLYCKYFEVEYDRLVDEITKIDPSIDLEKLDFLFCRDENLEAYKNLVLHQDTAPIDQLVGIKLEKGTNGDLDNPKYDTKDEEENIIPKRDTVITNLYKNTFKSIINEDINNKRSYPFDVILDANYPVEVKAEILEFCKQRGDVFPFFDAGLVASKNDAVVFRKNYFNVSTYIGALYGTTFKIKDPYGTSIIPVTMTYFLAGIIPPHDRNLGVQYPIAGPNYGLLSGFYPNSINFNPDDYAQEDLYLEQVNYVIQDQVTTEIGSQNTLQTQFSALSAINNVRSLFKMVRSIEDASRKYKFEFSDALTLSRFQDDLDVISSEWISNRTCQSLELTVIQSEYDKINKVARVKANIVFTGVIERIVIEINVGK